MSPPLGCKPIGLKWVFKLKKNSQGQVVRYKSRLVAKGYVQKAGVDFEEVFAPMARMETVQVLTSLVAQGNCKMHHLDVKPTFLNGEIKEDTFVKQPNGYIKNGEENYVLKLMKELYGFK